MTNSTNIISSLFNNTAELILVGCKGGFHILATKGSLESKFSSLFEIGDIGKVFILGKSNLVGYVGGGDKPLSSKEELILVDVRKGGKNPENKIKCSEQIIQAHIRETFTVIVTKNHVRIYDNESNPTYKCETKENPKGLLTDYRSIIAYASKKVGHVEIWPNPKANNKTFELNCHLNEIQCLALNRNGTRLATTSSGKYVRVWAIGDTASECKKIGDFKRSAFYGAEVHAIDFSMSGNHLLMLSGNGTLHTWNILNSKWLKYKTIPMPAIARFDVSNDEIIHVISNSKMYIKLNYKPEENIITKIDIKDIEKAIYEDKEEGD